MDITDVPEGTYTMVVRTNWQQRPDKLGRHETDYTNNYAHVCINIARNAQNVPSFSVVSGCTPVVDCTGQAFGSVKEDCTGACAGTAKTGDLSVDNLRRAVIYGSVMGSFAVERFSVERLISVTPKEIAARVGEFKKLVAFEDHKA
jgi:hypothetical protein